jgi:hypothetical protein
VDVDAELEPSVRRTWRPRGGGGMTDEPTPPPSMWSPI